MTPTSAARIWSVGDELKVEFPPLEGNTTSNTVTFPCTPSGVQALIAVLRSREAAKPSDLTIGTKATPNQWNLEELIKQFSGNITKLGPKAAAKEDLTLEDLDL